MKRIYAINSPGIKQLVQEYDDVFKGIGCLQVKHHIELKEEASPVVHAPRKVPISLRNRLHKELNKLEKLNIVSKVDEPTDWVNSLVIVEKKTGQLRLCIDPRDLNKNIKREHFHLPTKTEITAEMAGAKWFTKLDASNGFWQIELDKPSARLCTFNTPFGRYCFNRLPFGICSSPEVFHKTVSQMCAGIDGVQVFIDDIIIWGRNKDQHDQRVKIVLDRIRKSGLKLNRNKCQFQVQSISFLGDKLTAEGIQPDNDKIADSRVMPAPKNIDELQTRLGLIKYLGRFIPNLSAETANIRHLLETDVEFRWTSTHEAEWNYVKQVIVSEPVLKFYDPSLPTMISSDASKDGIGAVLLQEHDSRWHPVSFASRTLTSAETRYAQIEKETLGIAFGCEKFHQYIYGKEIILETDHKPLISIARRNLSDCPPRIQRLLLKLQPYTFELIFTPGKHLVWADLLSRASNPNRESSTEVDVKVHVDMIVNSLPVSEQKWEEISRETKTDYKLSQVLKHVLDGWSGPCARLCQPYNSLVKNIFSEWCTPEGPEDNSTLLYAIIHAKSFA